MPNAIEQIAHPAHRFAYFKRENGKYERHHIPDVDAIDAAARWPDAWSLTPPEDGEIVDMVAQMPTAVEPNPGAAPSAGHLTTAPASGTIVGIRPDQHEKALAAKDAEHTAALNDRDSAHADVVKAKDDEIARLKADLAATQGGGRGGGKS